jgi:uncharacterized protein YbjT (DUF2867 family)
MSGPTIAVTGATGALGSRVAALLADRGVPQLLLGRQLERIPELAGAQRRGPAAYDDGPAMRQALTGADTLVLVSSRPTGRRLEEHAAAVEAGRAVGVQRVIYVSLLGAAPTATYRNARDHWLTEQFLAGSGVRHTIVRAGIYASTLTRLADDELVIRGPGGGGRTAFATHQDIAAVIATLAADPGTEHDGAVLQVTGPESLTLAETADRLAAATGRPYRYQDETVEDAFAWRWRQGQSGTQIESWISWYRAIATGELDFVTDDVRRITGTAAQSVDAAEWWPQPVSSLR